MGDHPMTKPRIFVFGSNLAGRHGAGSALEAIKNHGAFYGRGWGHQGNSYAIPTKDEHLGIMPLDEIQIHVDGFVDFATRHPELVFDVVAIGCGLAGYTASQMAPLFIRAPQNVVLPAEFLAIIRA